MVLLLVTVQDGGRIFSALMLKKRDDQQWKIGNDAAPPQLLNP